MTDRNLVKLVPPTLSPEELQQALVAYALDEPQQLREKLSRLTAEHAQLDRDFKTHIEDSKSELAAQKKESELQLASARATNEALRVQLKETGEKLEHYSTYSAAMKTRYEDFERFFVNGLTQIKHAGETVHLNLAVNLTNALTTLEASTKQLTEGLHKQIETFAEDAQSFQKEMREQSVKREFAPARAKPVEGNQNAKPVRFRDEKAYELSAQEEQSLKSLAASRFANAPHEP